MKFDVEKIRALVLSTTREQWESASRGADNSETIIKQHANCVPHGHYFLCDCIGNTVDLCLSTKRPFKNSKGRMVNCKVIETIIPDCRKKFGTALNGCWIIPDSCK
jgi:hypothetical protein